MIDEPTVEVENTSESSAETPTATGAYGRALACFGGFYVVANYSTVAIVSGAADKSTTESSRVLLDNAIEALETLRPPFPPDVAGALGNAANMYATVRSMDAEQVDWAAFKSDIERETAPFTAMQNGVCAPILRIGGACQPLVGEIDFTVDSTSVEYFVSLFGDFASAAEGDRACAEALGG